MEKKDLLKLKKILLAGFIISTSYNSFNTSNVKASEVTEIVNVDDNDFEISFNNEDSNLEALTSVTQVEVSDKEILNYEKRIIIDYIKYYSNVYGLDYKKVFDSISELTDNFEEYGFRTYNILNKVTYDDKEKAILYTIRDIYNNPNEYGFNSYSEIKADNIIPSELTLEQLIEKHANICNINKDVVLAICYTECGPNKSSVNYRTKNNPAGLRTKDGGWRSFPTIEAAVIFLTNLLKNSYGCTIDSDTAFLNRIATKYCPTEPGHWLSLSLPFYNKIQNDYYYNDPDSKLGENDDILTRKKTLNK